jgi:MarR family transcriptional regulator, organic hydroperoxide resistance regulator
MLVLWEQGAQTVKGLADALQLDSSTLTPLLKRLETAGWLTRTRDQADERIVRIELSAAGKSLRRPVADIQKTIACQTQLSESELVYLRERLHSLTLNMSPAELAEAAI